MTLFEAVEEVRDGPEDYAAFRAYGYDGFLVGGDFDGLDVARVRAPLVRVDAEVVVPEFDAFVVRAAHEEAAFFRHVERGHLGVAGVYDSDGVAGGGLPVGNFGVGAAGEDL